MFTCRLKSHSRRLGHCEDDESHVLHRRQRYDFIPLLANTARRHRQHTSIAVPVILTTKLMNTGHDVDVAIPWGQGHGGNYDLEELFDWIETISA